MTSVIAVKTPPPSGRPAPRRGRRLAPAVALALPVILGGCHLPSFWGYKNSPTSQGRNEFALYAWTWVAAIVVGVIVALLIAWAVFAYRRRSDEMPKQTQYHTLFEIVYTVIPIVIVLILFGYTFASENTVDAQSSKPDVKVLVTAFQWGWRFDYLRTSDERPMVYVLGTQRQDPDPVGADGQLNSCPTTAAHLSDCLGPGLVLPVGETVQIRLVSNDVIHGFYVPEFNFSRYAQPGVPNIIDFNVTRSGIFRAQCTQLCGLYHSEMYFHVVALPPDQYQAWLAGSQPVPEASSTPETADPRANLNVPPACPPTACSVQYPSAPTTTSTSSTTTSSTTTTTAPGTPTTIPA